MKLTLRHLLLTLSVFTLINNAAAQQPLGLMVGDLNTPYSVNMNPANVASQYKNRIYFNWWGSSLDIQSNFSDNNGWKRRPGSLKMDQSWMPSNANQAWSMNYLNETYGPSLYLMPDRNVGFGLGVKGVSGFNFSGVNPQLGNLLQQGRGAWDSAVGQTISQTSPFAFNTEKYQEWYLSFGSYVGDADARKGIRALKWGVTGKILVGMGAAHLSASKLDVKYNGNNGFVINDIMATYNYTDQTSVSNTMIRPLGMKFDLMNGIGAGVDMGFMYEYRPGIEAKYNGISGCEREINRTYRWKFGASLTDVGFISYTGSAYAVNASNANYTADSIFSIQQTYGGVPSNINQFDQIGNAASTLGSVPESSFISYTPMALNMQWDYRFSKWHVGAYWIHNLKPLDMPGLRRASTLSFVPRYQTERFEYGFPVSFVNDYSQMNVGAYLRVGPLVVGTNNLSGWSKYLGNTGTQSANFYIGFRSKIGDCSKEIIYDDIDQAPQDSAVMVDEVIEPPVKYADTVIIRDTIIKRDTIVKTEIKTVVKRDTVVVTKNVPTTTNNPAIQVALNDCQKRENDLKNKLAVLEAKEAAANNKTKSCEAELVKFKAESDKCKTELELLKAENERLRAENNRLRALAVVPNDKQLKYCDSVLTLELAKNQKLMAELAESKKAAGDCNVKLAEAIAKGKTCETDLANCKSQIAILQADKKRLEDQLKSVSIGEDCTPYKNKIAELEKLLAAEKLKTAQLTVDLANCNKSVESLKAQLAAEQVKNAECDKAKATLLAELEAAKKKIAELEEKLKSASTNKGSDCSKTRDSLNQALLDLSIAKNAYDALMAEYQDCLKSAKSYKDQLKACEDKLAAGSSDASTLDALKAEIAKLKITITELNGEVAAGKKSLEVCQESLAEKDALIKSLQDQLKGKNADITTLQGQLRTAQTQLNDLKARLAKCEEEKAANTSSSPTGTGTSGGITPGGIAPGGGL
jgi:septal ring factor EnvC (AmiA/AmiB activator)